MLLDFIRVKFEQEMTMRSEDRKAAIAAYKERKSAAGVFVVRCTATAECWVGKAPDVRTIRNRLWFGLGLGTFPKRRLQAEFRRHGEGAFTFEVLEVIDPELGRYAAAQALDERLAHWRRALGADAL